MARLSLSLLGPVLITLDGQPVSGFAYHKARALLAYLVVEAGRPHHRDALVGLLWPDVRDQAARTNLRQVLAHLREAISDASATPPFLLITRDTIQLNPASDYELDQTAFTALPASCKAHPHRHLERCRSCAARMAQAVTLYRGDFLAEFSIGDSAPFEEWQLRWRERLHQQALDALAHLADYHERRGEDEHARNYAQQQVDLEPWREEAHRQLMRLLARGGQRSAALAQYETCRHILARDLGVGPEAESTALYERIRDGALRTENQEPRTRQTHYTRLPVPPTPLIGRASELAELGALLENPACRLITIVGPGGIGKTRLVLAAAAEQAEAFTHSAAFVPLQAISSAAFVVPAILASLAIPLQRQRDPRDQLLDYLREKELLLVLDNVEQLLAPGSSHGEGVADLLSDVLHHAPGVTLLVTSRARLALPGEWLFDLAGLNYPPGEPFTDIEGCSAVRLFVQRAGQVRRHFVLSGGEARAVARICRLVEGLPLAIELAAAALRTRSCTAIADAIETSLSALTTGMRAIPERHRSMWATFEHSWRLLTDEEQLVFARLSVFRGGFEEEAAAQVAQATPELLAALIDKSLLRWDGVARYDLHELVRQYAGEKLEAAGEATDIRQHHAAYFLELAQATEPKFRGPEQRIWLARFEAEHDNLRAVLAWSRTVPDDAAIGLRLAGSLSEFWGCDWYFSEGRRWLEEMLEPPSTLVHSAARAKALMGAGTLAWAQGHYAAAQSRLAESVQIWRELGDKQHLAAALSGLGKTVDAQGDYATASSALEQSLALRRELQDTWGIAEALQLLGHVAIDQGDLSVAHAHFEESLALFHETGDSASATWALCDSGMVVLMQGDVAQATRLLEESLAGFREQDDLAGIAWVHNHLSYVAQLQGDIARAVRLLEASLVISREYGANQGITWGLAGLAGVASATGQPARAVRLWAAAEALRAAIGSRPRPSDHQYYEQLVAAARTQLDATTYAAAWATGRAMTVEQAIAYALEESEIDFGILDRNRSTTVIGAPGI